MTKPRISIFLVLFAIVFGLVRGPHPCRAEAPTSAPAMSEAMESMERKGCHGHTAPAKAPSTPESSDDSDEARKERLCEKACQRTAILVVQLPLIPESPVSFTSPVVEVRLQTLLVEPIDHVPLA